jgi:two-component system OmpR family response regulator
MRVLLIEDDVSLCATLHSHLTRSGFVVDIAHDGRIGEDMGRDPDYAAAVVDLGLPGRPGLQILSHWRQQGSTLPVIVLTARNTWRERIEGIETGADDYLGKPFHMEELVTRLRALIRRSHTRTQGMLTVGPLTLDERLKQVTLAPDQVIPLTAIEFRLLRCFMVNRQRILSKDLLFSHLYDVNVDLDANIIETHVMRLRKKIGGEWIQTRRGHGYILSVPPS